MYLKSACAIAALCVASSAAAQDAAPQCGDLAPGSWAMENAAMSDIATAPEPFEVVSIAPLGQTIMTAFTLSEPADIRLEAKGGMGGDTVIELFTADGLSVEVDDDSGGDSNSRIETGLAAGQYCLETSSYNEGILAATVRIGRTEHDPLTEGLTQIEEVDTEACSDPSTVQMMVNPDENGQFDSIEYRVTPADDAFLQLELTSPAAILLEAENEEADPVLDLYDAAGELIASNDDANGLNSMIELASPLDAGSYCVKVGAINDASLPIMFRAGYLDADAMRERSFDTGDTAPPLDGSYPVQDLGALGVSVRADVDKQDVATWFSFTVEDHVLVVAEAVSDDVDPALELFDDLGRSVGYNDDHQTDGSLNSLVFGELRPGTYTLALTSLEGEAGRVRIGLRKYVAAPE